MRPPDAGDRLAAHAPVFAPLVARIGPCGLTQRRADPYEALVAAITGQQLNTRAAEIILGRLVALYPDAPFPTPDLILATDPGTMRNCGLSGAKITAIRTLAEARLAGIVPTEAEAATLEDEAIIARLVPLRGIGRWTVEMLLIFSLGRPDILPVDDFGVREGWRRLTLADEQLKPRALAALGLEWSPLRSTASWYLWQLANEKKARGSAPAPRQGPVSLDPSLK